MALATKSDLKASAANWLARSGDTSIDGMLDDAIALVEAKLNRNLRVGQMEASATLTGPNGAYTLPADYVGFREVKHSTCGPLEYAEPSWLDEKYPTNPGGIPHFFTIKGSTLYAYPANSDNLTLSYYQAIPALSDATPSNWLLASNPDIYLFMTLVEANAFTKDPDAASLWNERAKAAVDELRAQDALKRYGNAAIRVKGPTP